ncbi:tail fiber domain-containing protein [Clostridium sp.]|uniref:tail fiber domain-containing protein n=1 Tax=Clostridium sp. TaxID=1506 RepID=UPI00260ED700|nr:tail fiber domain-containing protein [Clostridium sp.]
MKTTNNGFQIPDVGNSSSSDSLGDIVNAIANNGNLDNQLFDYITPYFDGNGGLAIKRDNFTILNDFGVEVFQFSMDGLNNTGQEMGTLNTANTPYIDFHSSGNNVDYDSRIIAYNGTATKGGGQLDFVGSKITINGNNAMYSPNVTSFIYNYNNGSPYASFVTDNNGSWGIAIWASDEKLKENIKESVEKALPKLLKINHKQFNFKNATKTTSIGYSAQELQKINPEFVCSVKQEDGSEILQPRVDIFIPYITKGIQELNEKIESINNEWKSVIFKNKLHNKECIVKLKDLEIFNNIDLNILTYEIFVSPYGNGNVWVDLDDIHKDYFIVHGNNDINFVVDIKFKIKSY